MPECRPGLVHRRVVWRCEGVHDDGLLVHMRKRSQKAEVLGHDMTLKPILQKVLPQLCGSRCVVKWDVRCASARSGCPAVRSFPRWCDGTKTAERWARS